MSDKPKVFAVVTTKFHGGGILYRSRSPRQVLRWLRRHHDGCYNGRGCEVIAASYDGEAWYPAELDWYPVAGDWPPPAKLTYTYADGTAVVWVHDVLGPILPAERVVSATSPAL